MTRSDSRISRRTLLQRGALAFGAAALLPSRLRAQAPAAAGSAKTTISPLMTTLSNYMAAAKDRALPPEVVEKAKHHILDTLAAMVSGSELPPGRAALSLARAQAGRPIATVVGSNVVQKRRRYVPSQIRMARHSPIPVPRSCPQRLRWARSWARPANTTFAQ